MKRKKALVTGRGIDAIQVALELAEHGIAVTLVEESAALQVNSNGRSTEPGLIETLPLMPKLLKAASDRNISIITDATVEQVDGERGNFKATIVKHPRYVDVESCTSCGRCEQECPVNIVSPKSGAGNGHKAIHRPRYGLKSVPSTYVIEKKGIPPCTAACPAGINAHGYVALVSQGKFAEALDLITEAVAFPRVLGRVCSHPCQSECTRGKIDQPVSICALKRFVADSSSTESSLRRAQTAKNGMKLTGPPRVAIIGAGPAGLTAARDLARLGHRATVFEALPKPGGMITVGMPRFRLPREVRQADIEDIQRLGIEIRTSTPIGKDLTLDDLRRQGYQAILIATGAHKNQRLSVPGENLAGVIDSIALLQALNLKQPITVGRKVVVVGGGYTAIDSARTAIRLGCDRVVVLYRRSQEEMPANAEEVTEAHEEGVEFQFLVTPVRIIGEEGRVSGVECIRMRLGEPDLSGRCRPLTVGGSEFVVEVDTVIVAVGQRPDLSFLGSDTTLTDGKRYIVIDPLTMATKVPGIFAAGDVDGDPGTLIDAITAGRTAAGSIDRFLRGEELKKEALKRGTAVEVDLDEVYVPPVEHQPMPCLPLEARVDNFEEVDLGLTREMAIKEAQRCLNCAGCSECLECERACQLKAIDHTSRPQRLELRADVVVTTSAQPQDNGGTSPGSITPRRGIYFITPSRNGDGSRVSDIAARVIADLTKHGRTSKASEEVMPADAPEVRRQPSSVKSPSNLERRIGVFVCRCGGGISEAINIPRVFDYCRGLAGVTYVGQTGYACTTEGAAEIKSAASQHHLTHVVLAACACCNLDQICFSCSDRRLRCKANLLDSDSDGINYEFVNIREHCAWVHHEPEEATAKTRSIIRAGVARVSVDHVTGQGRGEAKALATVNRQRCRGCGTCVSICPSGAITLNELDSGVPTARVDEGVCRCCGTCVAHCPSGALTQSGYGDEQITASVRAILS